MGGDGEVRKGQLYKFRSGTGHPWHYLKITGISNDSRSVAWEEVSKLGNKKRKGKFHKGRTHLVWRDGLWQMPPHYQPANG